MAIRIPYGIDPDEVWELDFCAETARMNAQVQRASAESLREVAKSERDAKKRADLQASAARLEEKAAEADEELATYKLGSGPIFQVGPILARRRAELRGRYQEAMAMEPGVERSVAMAEWSRDVVAAAVTGHRNLLTARGMSVGYDSTDGRPSERTLEAYGPILLDLAWLIMGQQRLEAAGKNG